MSVEIRRASGRFTERVPGRLSRHGFSFGEHYDPDRLAFGPMVCHDDHVLGRDTCFADHAHASLEIVTWVVSGEVVHTDGTGASVVLGAGSAGVLSAGDGVRHAEIAGTQGAARFVQVWLTPDDPSGSPRHDWHVAEAGPGDGLVRIVGADGPLEVGVAGAALDVARLDALETVTLPAGPRVHAFVVTGALLRSSLAEPLAAGDAFLLTDEPAHQVRAAVPTELLVWTLP